MSTPDADQKPSSHEGEGGPSKEELKRALKAFRKRLKLMRLDDESRIGRGAMSGGGKSGIMAIKPPGKYPKEVWDALAKQGKLKYVGNGLYELTTT